MIKRPDPKEVAETRRRLRRERDKGKSLSQVLEEAKKSRRRGT